MADKKDLSLLCMAIGSLPHKNVEEAMELVEKNFTEIPFWPQLSRLNKNEDMIIQFLEQTPGLEIDIDNDKTYLNSENDTFYENLEQLFMDYEEVVSENNLNVLEKYAVSGDYSSTFSYFLKNVEKTQPKFAKGQIVGPFTLATTLCDNFGKSVFYDTTLKEIIVKILSLKALWQIKEIKRVSPSTTPIIFQDEPTLSQLRTSAFITIAPEEALSIIKEISDLIKENGGISAIHCCGKCDWENLLKTDCDIINFDAYMYSENFSLFSKSINEFLNNGGKIAWGIVPTLDKDALENATLEILIEKFDKAVNSLIKKGIDKDLILDNSLITPSCGAGSLSIELATKAMDLTNKLSKFLKGR